MTTTTPQSISAGLNVFSYNSHSLSAEEQTASIVTQAVISKLAQDNVNRMHMNVHDPDTYRSGAWWEAVTDAINRVMFPRIVGDVSGHSTHRSFGPPLTVADKLRSIMHSYIPSFTSEQLNVLITMLQTGQQGSRADGCMNFWHQGWNSSSTLASFAMGPSWKDTQTNEICCSMTFFCVTYTDSTWRGLFSSGHSQELDVYAGNYQVRFYLPFYEEKKFYLQIWLGGSIQDRIHNAPLG